MDTNTPETREPGEERNDSEARRARIEGGAKLGSFLLSVALLVLTVLIFVFLWPYVRTLLLTFGEQLRRLVSFLGQL